MCVWLHWHNSWNFGLRSHNYTALPEGDEAIMRTYLSCSLMILCSIKFHVCVAHVIDIFTNFKIRNVKTVNITDWEVGEVPCPLVPAHHPVETGELRKMEPRTTTIGPLARSKSSWTRPFVVHQIGACPPVQSRTMGIGGSGARNCSVLKERPRVPYPRASGTDRSIGTEWP